MSNSSRKVLFGVTIDYQLKYHEGLWEKLVANGWDVHLAATPGKNLRLSESDGISVHSLVMSRNPDLVKDLGALRRWIGLLARVKPEVIVLGTPKAALLGMLAGVFCRIPKRVYEVHGLRLEGASGWKQRVLSLMERMTCRLATTVVPVSHSLSTQLVARELAEPKRLRVLGSGSPNGVDLNRFEISRQDRSLRQSLLDELGLSSAKSIITFVGRLNEDKGLECLSRAMKRLSSELDIHLLVIGPADDNTSEKALERLRSSGITITATGEVEDAAPYLALSDVLCLPSRREGLPTVVLEAFAASVAVVATRATGLVDLVTHNETGSLVNIDDDAALASELKRVITDHKLAERYAARAREFVEAHYGSDYVQRNWIEFLESQVAN